VFFLIFSEITTRIFHISYNVPSMYGDKDGVIKFYPNQEGYRYGGKHKWYINKFGMPGYQLPKKFNNLILIIGDSYIQNFMNPDSCRQSVYLNRIQPNYNFVEGSREGATVLEDFEIAARFDTLRPVMKLMYVQKSDFTDCFSNIPSQIRFDIKNNKVIYAEYQESKLKPVIQFSNFGEYMFREHLSRYLFKMQTLFSNVKSKNHVQNNDLIKIGKLLGYIEKNYNMEKLIFIFHPRVSNDFMQFVKSYGFKCYKLKEGDGWYRKADIHWTCKGHFEIAQQVNQIIINEIDSLSSAN
jgi:hypothetical protein